MTFNSLPEGVRIAIEAAQNKKAAGISVLDLSDVGAFTSYFVIGGCGRFAKPYFGPLSYRMGIAG